jgi:predicted site-specific integrase-resolvase
MHGTVYPWNRTGKIKYIVTPGGWTRISRSEILRITREMQNGLEMLQE